jgi:hypothetical protein
MAGVGQKTQNPVSSLINWLMPGIFRGRRGETYKRLVSPDCVRHQEVRANRRDFLVRRIARHFRDLRRY